MGIFGCSCKCCSPSSYPCSNIHGGCFPCSYVPGVDMQATFVNLDGSQGKTVPLYYGHNDRVDDPQWFPYFSPPNVRCDTDNNIEYNLINAIDQNLFSCKTHLNIRTFNGANCSGLIAQQNLFWNSGQSHCCPDYYTVYSFNSGTIFQDLYSGVIITPVPTATLTQPTCCWWCEGDVPQSIMASASDGTTWNLAYCPNSCLWYGEATMHFPATSSFIFGPCPALDLDLSMWITHADLQEEAQWELFITTYDKPATITSGIVTFYCPGGGSILTSGNPCYGPPYNDTFGIWNAVFQSIDCLGPRPWTQLAGPFTFGYSSYVSPPTTITLTEG